MQGSGTFAVEGTLGVILGAVYMLWMYQRVMFGEITHVENRGLTDLSGREVALMVPLIILMFWIGLYPSTFLRKMDASSAHLLTQLRTERTLVVQPGDRQPLPPSASHLPPTVFGGRSR